MADRANFERRDIQLPDHLEQEQNIIGKSHFGLVYKLKLEDIKYVVRKVNPEILLMPLEKFKDMLMDVPPKREISKVWLVDPAKNYIVSEYISGSSLLKYFEKDKLNKRQCFEIALDVSEAMFYLHAHDIFHMDLSARNVMIMKSEGGSVLAKVVDYGIPKSNDYIKKTYTLNTRKDEDKPWLAPEVLLSDDPAANFTFEADVFCFGLLLWELYSFGKRPHFDISDKDAMNLNEEGTNMLSVPQNSSFRCPGEIVSLFKNCIKYNPEDRPTFQEARDVLLRIVNKLSGIYEQQAIESPQQSRTRLQFQRTTSFELTAEQAREKNFRTPPKKDFATPPKKDLQG